MVIVTTSLADIGLKIEERMSKISANGDVDVDGRRSRIMRV
jgi:hypothetical protein